MRDCNFEIVAMNSEGYDLPPSGNPHIAVSFLPDATIK